MCFAILALILFPTLATEGAVEGIRLCGTALIPALLPFLLVTKLMGDRLPEPKSLRNRKGISGCGLLAYGLSFVGGYPAGVATVVSFYKQGKLSKQEAQRWIPYCNNSGPGFFVGVLGVGLFGDPKKGLLLYGIHVFSALLVLLLCYREDGLRVQIRPLIRKERSTFPQAFQEALGDSCNTMIRICGLVILFSVLRKLFSHILPSALLPYMGLLELSSGLLTTGRDDLILWALFMGWGGLCVHMQAMSIWQEAGLKIKGYFFKKFLHGTLSALAAWGILCKKWELMGCIFILYCFFCLFYKNWGGKIQENRL